MVCNRFLGREEPAEEIPRDIEIEAKVLCAVKIGQAKPRTEQCTADQREDQLCIGPEYPAMLMIMAIAFRMFTLTGLVMLMAVLGAVALCGIFLDLRRCFGLVIRCHSLFLVGRAKGRIFFLVLFFLLFHILKFW